MALPKLNESPQYSLEVPSTKQKVKYRPYLVKEEKVLMIAFESGDQKQALEAIVDTLSACISEDVNVMDLTTFDIEYIFTQIRSKSVGETSTVLLTCSNCNHKNEYELDVSSIKVEVPKVENVIELTPSISVAMKYPSYRSVINTNLDGKEMEVGFEMVIHCIEAILTEDERFDTSDISKKELNEFVESMTAEQFMKISEFLQSMPALKHDAEFECVSCGEHNSVQLKGMQDFLS